MAVQITGVGGEIIFRTDKLAVVDGVLHCGNGIINSIQVSLIFDIRKRIHCIRISETGNTQIGYHDMHAVHFFAGAQQCWIEQCCRTCLRRGNAGVAHGHSTSVLGGKGLCK